MIRRARALKKNRLWRRPLWWEALPRARRSLAAAMCGIALAGALWYGAPWALHATRSHPYFALAAIEVEGNRRLSRAEILRWAGVDESTSAWDAAPELVRLRLQSHPWIQRVSTRREFPNHLTIQVEERRPVAIIRLDQLNYVDRRGNILGPLRDGDSTDFPLISGMDDKAAQGFAGVGVHRALRFLRLCERLNCFDAISEVHVDRERGITIFPLRTAVAVVLGWGGWREKLARSARVFAAWEGQVGRLAAVDVSFRDLVVVKLHEEHRPTAGRTPKKGIRV